MPAICLEGCDGAGKTTFVDMLQTEWREIYPVSSVYVLHRKQPEPGSTWESEYIVPLHETQWTPPTGFTGTDLSVLKPSDLVVMDRWHLGELIYGPLYRGKSMIDDSALHVIEQELDRMHVFKVLLSPPLDVVRERLNDRGEDFLEERHVEQVWKMYVTLATRLNWPMTTRTEPAVAKTVLRRAEEMWHSS